MTLSAFLLGIPWRKIGNWLLKAKVWIFVTMKPLGAWGIFGLMIADSAAIPLPVDPLIVSYGAAEPRKAVLYVLAAALGSATGSMIPYYLGRAGGELFLLKRINRERYEKLRDRFEKQEFLAIMLPSMSPPPMPLKLFELAAGVFEMRPLSFFLAIATGKFLRFAIETALVIFYGPAVLGMATHAVHQHLNVVLGVLGLVLVAIAIYVIRRIFDRRRGVVLPVEEPPPSDRSL